MNLKKPLHVTLRSSLAKKERSLLKHKPLIEKIIEKFSKRFHVEVYSYAIVSNHIHIVVKGETRTGLQNFFRVLAGHIAQGILEKFPLTPAEKDRRGGAPGARETKQPGGAPSPVDPKPVAGATRKPPPHPKNIRKFWDLLLYSRIVTWGRELKLVLAYVLQNALEAAGIVPYRERKRKYSTAHRTSSA